MSIVMGLDQHRAQITAEWLDTDRRFVVEELRRVGAELHLAEPAEAAALKGTKKRAKTRSRRRAPSARWPPSSQPR